MTKRVEGAARGRPPLPEDERRRPVNLTLTPEVVLGLDVLAEARGMSRSGVVEQLVQKALRPARRRA
jgi:hypothetical protein